MRITILGSSAGGGFPQWNCNCPMCDGHRKGVVRAAARTQSSITVSGDGENRLLFNASPDVLQQLRSFPALQPARALRDTAIRAIVLIDAQIDHTTGLYMLLEHRQPHQIWCTGLVREDLTTGNPLFKVLIPYERTGELANAWSYAEPGESSVTLSNSSNSASFVIADDQQRGRAADGWRHVLTIIETNLTEPIAPHKSR